MAKHKDTNRTRAILTGLRKTYPDARSELNFSNPYQMVVSVILSAQCTDKKVNQTTPALFEQYPSFEALSQAALSRIETIIRPVNYYKTKSKNIISMARAVVSDHGGNLPLTMEQLISLPGVGRKTANVVLCESGAVPALPVDTHVFRVSRRLALATGETPERVEQELCALFDSKEWRFLHHALILHGRRICKAQRPLCPECILSQLCPSRID